MCSCPYRLDTYLAAAGTKPAEAAFPGKNGKIAFESTRDGNDEIYSMNHDGTNQQNLTSSTANDGEPSWSPNGKKIAFESYRISNTEIFVMNTDGTGARNLTKNSANDGSASWSPDGRR